MTRIKMLGGETDYSQVEYVQKEGAKLQFIPTKYQHQQNLIFKFSLYIYFFIHLR